MCVIGRGREEVRGGVEPRYSRCGEVPRAERGGSLSVEAAPRRDLGLLGVTE